MTNRTTSSSSLPRPRTNSTVAPSTSTSSKIPPPFKLTPPSALLASHNANANASISRSPSFSAQTTPSSPSNTTSTSSSSTQRLRKPPMGASGSMSVKEEEMRKPVKRKISTTLFRGEGPELANKDAVATVRPGSIKRKPAPVLNEATNSTPLPASTSRARATSGPSVPASEMSYQRKPSRTLQNTRQRVSSVTAGTDSLPPTSPPPPPVPSSSTVPGNPSRASSPHSHSTNQTTTSPPKLTATTPSSRLRAPSITTKSTPSNSSAVPSHPPSSQQVAPARSLVRPGQSQNFSYLAPVSTPPRTTRSAPSSVRRLSQVQEVSRSPSYTSANASSTSSPANPPLPPSRQAIISSASTITPSSTRLRTPSLGNSSALPLKATPPPKRLRTSSTTTSTASTPLVPSAVRRIRTPSLITPSTPTPAGVVTSALPIKNKALLFPRIDSGDESSGSVYSQASASHKEDPGAVYEDQEQGRTIKAPNYMNRKINVAQPVSSKPDLNASRSPSKDPQPMSPSPPSFSSSSLSSRTPPTRALKVETRTVKTSISDSSLRPAGPREPLSSRTPTSAPTTATTLTPSQRPSPPSTITSNQSFSSLISIYTSTTDAQSTSASSQVSPSLSDTSSDTRTSRRIAPAPNSIFGFGMSGSERSADEWKGKRGRIPSFVEGSSASGEREVGDAERMARREKSMSIATVRGLGGMMRDEDGRTIGDDPGGGKERNLPSPAPSPSPSPSPLSPIPRVVPPSITAEPHATSPTRPHHSPKRLSLVPQRLGTDDMKRLLSKPAVPANSSTSDSEGYVHRKLSTSGVGSASLIPMSPRKRVASDQSNLSTSNHESKKPVIAGSNWVAPWDVHKDGRSVSATTGGKGFSLLGRTPSLGRKASEEFLTWRKEKEMTMTPTSTVKEKRTRNVLRKPSIKNLNLSAPEGLRPPLRSRSPSLSRSGNSSSGGSSPSRAPKLVSSPIVRTPAEEIMMAYKQQAAREQIIERDFGDEMKVGEVFAMEEENRKKSRGIELEPRGQPEMRMRRGDPAVARSSTTPATPFKDSMPAKHAPTVKSSSLPLKHEDYASTAPQERKREPERSPPALHAPSYSPLDSTTGQVVAVGSEKDAFLPSFWDNSAINLASQLGIGDGNVSSKASRPQAPITPSKDSPKNTFGRPSLQERRLSLSRLLTVSPPDPSSLHLDSPQEAASAAVVAVDLTSPSVSRTTTGLSIPSPSGTKAGKGGIWNLMKRISAGGLRDKYQQSDSDPSSPNTSPPPVPSLPKDLLTTKVSPPMKSKLPTAPATPITLLVSPYEATSSQTVELRQSGDWRPLVTSKGQTASPTSSNTTGSNRPSTTTRSSSSPVSSSGNRPGDSRTSSSSYSEEIPTKRVKLQQHILSPNELSRLQRDFEQEYEEKDRLSTRPFSKTSTWVVGSPRSNTTASSRRPSDEWMIVGTPIETPSFSLPLPPPRRNKPRSNPSSPSRPSTAPGPPSVPPSPIKSMRKTSVNVSSGHRLLSSKQAMSDDGHDTPPSRLESIPQGRKSTSAIPRPSNSSSRVPFPSRSGVVFRELSLSKRTLKDGLSEQEKADKWDDLLLRSDLAGGTLHLGAADRLESDELRFSVADSEDDTNR